ncbi:class I SAM-dependent methyltransferase [Aquisalimonas lutea]|uniref:class I SAM-dependent methyltransferase n=1 Tax=Aquisalimonas lutea TaxID=1327750 RepID=UPI0025B32293|nr:class I SAM-dependent methyltransferase [Aquisalimonas lutea]MDN3519056.1 class I SAM-dependent methyltransferase [Aquisalimonas lutea]
MNGVGHSHSRAVAWYDAHAVAAAERYEQLEVGEVHDWLIPRLPRRPGTTVLDVGAGSGRDAAWFADGGYEVVAVEPSAGLRTEGKRRHPDPRIRWVNDHLPGLDKVTRLGMSFELILLSAVWMHVPPLERSRAFRKLIMLLKPGGMLAITLRQGPAEAERGMHEATAEEVMRLGRSHGAYVEHVDESPDAQGREGINWAQIAIRLPDDGTGALPLLRHIILNDDKSSTYKLALLRCLCRIADSADGLARHGSDETVDLPFGLVALTWIRAFQPLIARRLPQRPGHDGTTRGLGFAKEGFLRLLQLQVTPSDLHVGMRFTGDRAMALSMAIREATANIAMMPAQYTTYPNGGPVFRVQRPRTIHQPQDVVVDAPFLWQFGTFRVPLDVWRALQRFSVWIEPSVETEWKRLMAQYLERQMRHVEPAEIEQAMVWSEPQRDVRIARDRVEALRAEGEPIYCIWSGRRLLDNRFDVDHCFPWAAWPCEDLWNLLPASRPVNSQKGARIPDAHTLQEAQDHIMNWWERAWCRTDHPGLYERFGREAAATLGGLDTRESIELEDVFSAVSLRRIRLKHDQQVPEWQYLSN